ncbi:MAG: Glu/Leu/Phe/Val dehydrogenase dimerization domain-containing protein [Pyrinomonadaceae bacterium]
MTDDGYRKYKEFFKVRPLLTLEWNDDETDSVGWLVINSLRGGAAGGGTRMRENATREEAVFLAKTMEVKFRISGPAIGGAKSVIKVNFDPRDEEKMRGVLSRWYRAIRLFLRNCYGTGGDLNVREGEVKRLTHDLLDLSHPQEGIVRGHFRLTEGEYGRIFGQLNDGVEMYLPDPPGSFMVANMITGYGLARSLRHYYEFRGERLEGKRVLIEGFGEVGGSAAFYLAGEGARVVGVLSLANALGSGNGVGQRRSWAVDDDGLNVNDLLQRRERSCLPRDCETGSVEESEEFWKVEADIFVPAAASYTVNSSIIRKLRGAGVNTIACGSNVPFSFEAKDEADGVVGDGNDGRDVSEIKDISELKDISEMAEHSLTTQIEADKEFGIIPDFIANCGMARVFAYLMTPGANVSVASIFGDTDDTIRRKMLELLAGHGGGVGLLNRAYSLYIPDVK